MKFINTTAGPQPSSLQGHFLPMLYLIDRPSPIIELPPIDMSTLNLHKKNLNNSDNVSMSLSQIKHQLSGKSGWLMDCSRRPLNQQHHKWVQGWRIVRGFEVSRRERLSDEDKKLFNSQQGLRIILQQSLLREKDKGFLGPLSQKLCESLRESRGWAQIVRFCKKHQVPIVLQELDQSQAVPLLSQVKEIGFRKIVFWESPLQITQDWAHFQAKYTLASQALLFRVLQQGCFLAFNLIRKSDLQIKFIASLIKAYPQQVLIACSPRYKTDLSLFAGQGFFALQKISSYIDKSQLQLSASVKWIQLLSWGREEIIQQVKKGWLCAICCKECKDRKEMFTKGGFDFCSMTCLRKKF